jgi:phosphoglycolate phosphatase
MPSQDPPLIVFDLDGTLVDSAPDLIDALNVVLAREGLGPLPVEIARKFVGRGGRALIRQGFAASGRDIGDSHLETVFAAFIAHYERHLTDKTVFYDGVDAALDRLAAAGHRFAVCTNKFERPARLLLQQLGRADRFAAIVGQDTFPVSKPNGAVLRLTIEKAGGDPARAIMVGDTITDVATARDAGLPVVVVDFGYAPELAELQADRTISHFRELPRAVEALTVGLGRPVAFADDGALSTPTGGRDRD